MKGLADKLRNCGAFYIRRSFSEDVLYRTIFSEYVQNIVADGQNFLEFFIEGTRSRTGKSLHPRLGMADLRKWKGQKILLFSQQSNQFVEKMSVFCVTKHADKTCSCGSIFAMHMLYCFAQNGHSSAHAGSFSMVCALSQLLRCNTLESADTLNGMTPGVFGFRKHKKKKADQFAGKVCFLSDQVCLTCNIVLWRCLCRNDEGSSAAVLQNCNQQHRPLPDDNQLRTPTGRGSTRAQHAWSAEGEGVELGKANARVRKRHCLVVNSCPL